MAYRTLHEFWDLFRCGLAHRYAIVGLMVLAFLISIPAIKNEFFSDDFVHKMKILGSGTLVAKELLDRDSGTLHNTLMSLFAWGHSEGQIRKAMNFGTSPWWTFTRGKISFWHPLTAF